MFQKPPKIRTLWDKGFFIQLIMLIPLVIICIPTSFSRAQQFHELFIPTPKDLIPSILFLIMFLLLRHFCADYLFLKIDVCQQ